MKVLSVLIALLFATSAQASLIQFNLSGVFDNPADSFVGRTYAVSLLLESPAALTSFETAVSGSDRCVSAFDSSFKLQSTNVTVSGAPFSANFNNTGTYRGFPLFTCGGFDNSFDIRGKDGSRLNFQFDSIIKYTEKQLLASKDPFFDLLSAPKGLSFLRLQESSGVEHLTSRPSTKVSMVPEPTSLALMLSSLALLGFARRVRRSS